MIYSINNENITISINDKGGELWSIKDCKDMEYLWQGDEKYWSDRAINLFPYIARLTDGKYYYQGNTYRMDTHGFLKDSTLDILEQKSDEITFYTQSNEKTLSQYPFDFILKIKYKLKESGLEISYIVENTGKNTMYFGIGGHPGFNVPMDKTIEFEDYYLEFSQSKEVMKRVEMSEDCFVLQGRTPIIETVENQRVIKKLSHNMFNEDAIILSNISKGVKLKSDKNNKYIDIKFENMDYLGIWHMPNTDAPYICIEPWTSLPSRKGVIEDIEKQDNLVKLETGKIYKNKWSIDIGGIYD